MASSSSTKLSLKLLIDAKHEKVLFAEASKAVIDFLFSLLCLPIGTVIRILNKNQMVGSLGNLDETYMQPQQHKDLLLKPSAPISSQISGLLPSINYSFSNNSTNVFYRCANHYGYVTFDRNTRCPECVGTMNREMRLVGDKVAKEIFADKNGFVKEVVTYMVMDDLLIQPMSSISSITLLNKFNVKEVGALEEKVVELDMNQGVNLLKASLQSKTVLTDIFLKNHTSKPVFAQSNWAPVFSQGQ